MRANLAKYLREIGTPRLAVIGDAILDKYVWGQVERVSPEGPIPVLRATRRELRAGGAGSVVVNLARLESEVSFFSVRGDDEGGDELRNLLANEGVELTGLVVDLDRPTTVKTRYVGYVQHAHRAAQQVLRVDDEVLTPISRDAVDSLVAAFSARAQDFDAVLVSDYKKGLVDEELLRRLRAAAPDVPFLVDPAVRTDYSLYRGCHLICPNRYEAQSASDISCRDVDGCTRAARRLCSDVELQYVALTMDADGILLASRSGGEEQFPTRARTVSDVTGAGDMVLSVLGLVVGAGGGVPLAVQLANVAAGLEVRRLGVTPLTRGEIIGEILFEGRPGASKVRTLDELSTLTREAREAGKRIVFTNGCFDLFHAGHYHLLNGAAEAGDVLIVAINSDASVSELKGKGRPVIPLEDRLLHIGGLEVVDHVVSFDSPTPMVLLEELRPDVLVKGGDYRDGEVVGAEFVRGYGGTIELIPLLPGVSTTALITSTVADKPSRS